MTPQLQQAIRLLQLSRLELVETVQRELLENPFLEEVQEEPVPTEQNEVRKEVQQPDETYDREVARSEDWEDYLGEFASTPQSMQPRDHELPEEMSSLEARYASSPTLESHLMWQLRLSSLTDEQKEIGEIMGRHLAVELLSSGFFEGIDMLVPVPLHKKKEKLRGYNQSEWIARGVSVITLIPVFTSGMVREKNTETQTHKSAFERWENVDGIFRVTIPEYFSGKHILIIDDVLTTGATIVACASAFDKVEDIRISILTLAVAE